MVGFLSHRFNQLKKADEEAQTFVLVYANPCYFKRKRPKLVSVLLLSLVSCIFIFAPHLLFRSSSSLSLLYSFGAPNEDFDTDIDVIAPVCSSIPKGTICCDRSHFRSDVCVMKGDVRTHSASSSIFVYSSSKGNGSISNVADISKHDEQKGEELQREKIKPYTRKWETSVMDTIDELDLVSAIGNLGMNHHCDVIHDVPAVFFSTGGYTGNVYHEFNDGILPLYITSQHLKKQVVFVILEYHPWWITKYGDVLSHLSDYPAIDFSGDNKTHCFPEAIVGLRIHDELSVDSSLMKGNRSIVDFHYLLDRAYWPRIRGLIQDEEREVQERLKEKLSLSPQSSIEEKVETIRPRRPRLVIQSRNSSRAITNQDLLVKVAEEIGFEVLVLRPDRTTELAKIYRVLNSSDVMVGVHGAAMTHFLFMKPGGVFIQVIPLGTDWAAETYYGEPARKLGLKYVGYEIHAKESSLYDEYDEDDPVLTNPDSINKKGWQFTKKIYLDGQNVRLDLRRFRRRLVGAYGYSVSRINAQLHLQSE